MTKRQFDRELKRLGMEPAKTAGYIAITWNCEFPLSRCRGMALEETLEELKAARERFLHDFTHNRIPGTMGYELAAERERAKRCEIKS